MCERFLRFVEFIVLRLSNKKKFTQLSEFFCCLSRQIQRLYHSLAIDPSFCCHRLTIFLCFEAFHDLENFMDVFLRQVILVPENISDSCRARPMRHVECVNSRKRLFFSFDVLMGSIGRVYICLLYTSPSPRDGLLSRMPSSA